MSPRTASKTTRVRVAVTGSRHYADEAAVERAFQYIYELTGPFFLLVGDATGADAIARRLHDPEFQQVFVADWKTHGRAAGPIRNREMLDAGAHYLLAFVEPCDCDRYPGTHATHGTQDCINAAQERYIPVLAVVPPGVELTQAVESGMLET